MTIFALGIAISIKKIKMEAAKQIPYGVSDFESVIERDLYYVDKTMYLADLEKQPDTLIFIRPRRFGKSLFISMMRAYYDKSKADSFDKLFGSLWIGSHPTPLRNHYQVLYLDFSRILGNIEVLEEKFNTIRNGKGICFAVPLSSVIGVNLYQFLSDNRMGREASL